MNSKTVAAVLLLIAGCGPQVHMYPAPVWKKQQHSPEQRPALAAALEAVISRLDPRAAAVCLMFGGSRTAGYVSPDTAFLALLRPLRTVVSARQCPRTYQTMAAQVDTAGRTLPSGRPEGYVDPFRLNVIEEQYFLPDSAVIHIDKRQGTGGMNFRCFAKAEGATWRANCRLTSSWIS